MATTAKVDPLTLNDPVQAGLVAISQGLQRRGYLTTEWWTTVIGAALSVVLSYVHVSSSASAQTASILAPALLAAAYAVARTSQKSALSDVLQAALPNATGQQAVNAVPAPVATTQAPAGSPAP